MATCAIFGCDNTSKKKKCIDAGIKFHSFPKNKEMRRKWIASCRPPWNKFCTKKAYICSIHFKESYLKNNMQHTMLQYSVKKFRYLTKDAVPTEHLSPPVLETQEHRTNLLDYLYSKFRISSLQPSIRAQNRKNLPVNGLEISTSDLLTMKIFINELENKVSHLKEECKCLFKENNALKVANSQLQCQTKVLSERRNMSVVQKEMKNSGVKSEDSKGIPPRFLLFLKPPSLIRPLVIKDSGSVNKEGLNMIVKEEPKEDTELPQELDHSTKQEIDDSSIFEQDGSCRILQEEFEEDFEMKPDLSKHDLNNYRHEEQEENKNLPIYHALISGVKEEQEIIQSYSLESRFNSPEESSKEWQKIQPHFSTGEIQATTLPSEISESQQKIQKDHLACSTLSSEVCSELGSPIVQEDHFICSKTNHFQDFKAIDELDHNSSFHPPNSHFTFVDCNSFDESKPLSCLLELEDSDANLSKEINLTSDPQSDSFIEDKHSGGRRCVSTASNSPEH